LAETATKEYRLSPEAKLTRFASDILVKVGVSRADADTVATILVNADLRGVESHGMARLDSFYVSRIRDGDLKPAPNVTVVRETPTTIVLDADNGLGHPASVRAMQSVIAKAKQSGVAFGAVRNSNHFGIAGYYAMLALEHDLIGIASTNSARYGAPTYGKSLMLGTNPWAYAVPAQNEHARQARSPRAQRETAQPRLGHRCGGSGDPEPGEGAARLALTARRFRRR
jgi:L-2-hydroxycarboxylate dehydrogenase (NAD+)